MADEVTRERVDEIREYLDSGPPFFERGYAHELVRFIAQQDQQLLKSASQVDLLMDRLQRKDALLLEKQKLLHDYANSLAQACAERCASVGHELHCGCVGYLRKAIRNRDAEIAQLQAKLDTAVGGSPWFQTMREEVAKESTAEIARLREKLDNVINDWQPLPKDD